MSTPHVSIPPLSGKTGTPAGIVITSIVSPPVLSAIESMRAQIPSGMRTLRLFEKPP